MLRDRLQRDYMTTCDSTAIQPFEDNLEHNIRMVLVSVSRGEMSVDQAWVVIDDQLSGYIVEQCESAIRDYSERED